jgi:lipopolysaccharide transport system permease protein
MNLHATTWNRSSDLLWEWTSRTLRARYQQSLLGWVWALVQPAAQALIFAVVFTRIVPVETGGTPYVLFAYVATVPWTFLASSLTDMANSVVDNMNLVNKIYFPREILPIAAMLARLADAAVAALLFLVLAYYFRVRFFSPVLAFLPVIVIVQVLMVTGIGLASAAVNVFVRDVRSVLLLLTQVWFYASPVIYPITQVPAPYRPYFALNPMVGVLEAYRAVLLRGDHPGPEFAVAAVSSLLAFLVGYALFKRVEFKFADIV